MVILTPPKTASTSLHAWAADAGWIAYEQHEMTVRAVFSGYRVFCTVRQPFPRVLSLWNHYAAAMRRHIASRYFCSVRDIPEVEPSQRHSIMTWVKNRKQIDPFFGQTCKEWSNLSNHRIDGWIRTENVIGDMRSHDIEPPPGQMPEKNKSPKSHPLITIETVDAIIDEFLSDAVVWEKQRERVE